MRLCLVVAWVVVSFACSGSPPLAERTSAPPPAAEAGLPPAPAPAPPGPTVTIAGADEPGERLAVDVRVLDMDGRPLARAAVVAYHADRAGLYNPPDAGTRVPRLRAVGVTDDDGWARFETIRPGSYPGERPPPAHVHLIVSAPAHQEQHTEIWFADDPALTAEHRRHAAGGGAVLAPAGPRVVTTIKLSGN